MTLSRIVLSRKYHVEMFTVDKVSVEIFSLETGSVKIESVKNLTVLKMILGICNQSFQVRIFCLVATMPSQHESKAKHVKATWGKRCDILYFVSTQEDEHLPIIKVSGQESRRILWNKTRYKR